MSGGLKTFGRGRGQDKGIRKVRNGEKRKRKKRRKRERKCRKKKNK